MTDVALRIRDEALRLSEADRSALVDVLLESLGENFSDDSEAVWVRELDRRVEDLKTGRAIAEPADKVMAELREERP